MKNDSGIMDFQSGLKLSKPLVRQYMAVPTYEDKEVSHLAYCRYGDDQGKHGACVPFAYAGLSQWLGRAFPSGLTTSRGIIHGIPGGENITNTATIKAYYSATDNVDEGMVFPDGYMLAKRVEWITGSKFLQAQKNDVLLTQQPLLTGMEITEDWIKNGNVLANGRFRSLKSTKSLGYHAVLMIGKGLFDKEWLVYLLTPWRLENGQMWGAYGVTTLPQSYVQDWCRELWAVT